MSEFTFPPRLSAPLAIVDVSLVPMDTSKIIPHQTVIIEDGWITAIGPAAQVPVEEAHVIDGRDKFVLPGLADMHVHFWERGQGALFLANGVTTVRNMWGEPLHRAIQEENRKGFAPGPRLITTSPLIDGLNRDGRTIWNGSNYVEDAERAGRFVRRYAEQGYRQIKVYSQLRHETLAALGKAAADNGVVLVGHCPNPMTFEEAIGKGMRCFEHLTNVFFGHFNEGVGSLRDGEGWDPQNRVNILRTVVEGTDFDAIRRLAASMAETEVWNCPTITVWQGGVPDPARAADPRLDYMPPWTPGWWSQRPKPTDEEGSLLRAAVEQRTRVLSMLREEGAPVITGTDTPNPYCFQGFSLHDEIDNFLKAGYTPYETIRASTFEAARFVGEEKEWGSVAEGKRADLILVSENPLEKVETLRNPEGVLSNGYYFAREDLEALLTERSRKVKEFPEAKAIHLDHDHHSRHFKETQFGTATGRICCLSMPRPDGGLIIEEKRSNSEGSVTSRRIFLMSDRKLDRAEQTTTSSLGEEHLTVERTFNGYTARVRSIDQFEIDSEVESDPLYPSELFGISSIAEMLSRAEGEIIHTLSVDHGELTVVEAKLERKEDGSISVTFRRPGTPSEQTYRLDEGSELIEVHDFLWGPRETTLDSTSSEKVD